MPTIELTEHEAERLADILTQARDIVLLAKVRRALGWRLCVVCGKPFAGKGRAVYCGPSCRQNAYRKRARDRRRTR